MDDSKGYKRFKLIFHAFILIVGVVLIIASVAGWNEINRSLLYLILGIVFVGESLFSIYRTFRNRKVQ